MPFRLDLTDVRRSDDLSDYVGELELAVDLQVTDAQPFGGAIEPATTVTVGYSVPVGCAATAAGSIGGRCTVVTSADAIAPATVREGWRTLWQLDRVRVLDGGADGRAATADNFAFATQGIFIP